MIYQEMETGVRVEMLGVRLELSGRLPVFQVKVNSYQSARSDKYISPANMLVGINNKRIISYYAWCDWSVLWAVFHCMAH